MGEGPGWDHRPQYQQAWGDNTKDLTHDPWPRQRTRLDICGGDPWTPRKDAHKAAWDIKTPKKCIIRPETWTPKHGPSQVWSPKQSRAQTCSPKQGGSTKTWSPQRANTSQE